MMGRAVSRNERGLFESGHFHGTAKRTAGPSRFIDMTFPQITGKV